MPFDLIDLRLFVAVSETRSITRGAAKVHLALAAASVRVKNLEQTVGAALLVRGRRGVALTATGETMRDHARIVLGDIERMHGDLAAQARGLRATIHLLTNTAGLSEHLPRPLAAFLSANPAVNIDVEERESTDIVAAIMAGAADIGIAIDRNVPSGVTRYPFCTDRLMLAVPLRDALANRRSAAFADLLDRDFVGLDEGSALQSHLSAQAARLGRRVTHRARMKGFDAVCQMVAAGVGIAILPEATARRCAKTMPIRILAVKDDWASRPLAICIRDPARLSKPVRSLVTHLRAYTREVAAIN